MIQVFWIHCYIIPVLLSCSSDFCCSRQPMGRVQHADQDYSQMADQHMQPQMQSQTYVCVQVSSITGNTCSLKCSPKHSSVCRLVPSQHMHAQMQSQTYVCVQFGSITTHAVSNAVSNIALCAG